METKTINNILSESNVIIPEIQREYVWGNNETLISKFLEDISNCEKTKKDFNVGFLYSYKPNEYKNDVFLIDGQQRFTTLVLLAFYCSAIENRNHDFFKLIKLNMAMPSFSYRVRSCTEMFMINLFKRGVKINATNLSNEIKDKTWFLKSFEQDVSIKAMLEALNTFQKFFKTNSITYDYVVNQLSFWYFNIDKTSQGEELYITMNSRGEILTTSEQLKPILFEKIDNKVEKENYGKKWDNWEEEFYKLKGAENIKAVDLMMDRFIQTILQIEYKTENKLSDITQKENLSLSTIERYFEAFFRIKNENNLFDNDMFSCLSKEKQENKHLFPFAILLKSIYCNPKIESSELTRIYQIITNAIRRGSIKSYKALLDFITTYNGDSFYEFIIKNPDPITIKNIFDEHELRKIEIINNYSNIEQIENIFWDVQNNLSYILSGSFKPIWHEMFEDNGATYWGENELSEFVRKKELLAEVFSSDNISRLLSENNCSQDNNIIDNSLISRALLTIDDYTIHSGGSNWCFGYNGYWKDIFYNPKSSKIISHLISKIHDIIKNKNSITIKNALNILIDDFIIKSNSDLSKKNSLYYFVKYPESFQAIEHGCNILTFWSDWTDYRVEVLNKTRLSSWHVNPFATAVYFRLDRSNINKIDRCTTINYRTGLKFENNIHLITDSTHSWNVFLPISIDSKYLPKGFVQENINNSLYYVYNIEITEDLIEKGVALAYELARIKVNSQ